MKEIENEFGNRLLFKAVPGISIEIVKIFVGEFCVFAFQAFPDFAGFGKKQGEHKPFAEMVELAAGSCNVGVFYRVEFFA